MALIDGVYHGTTREFEMFCLDEAHSEARVGRGIYFSSSRDDAECNYASSSGPDLASKMEMLIEREIASAAEVREKFLQNQGKLFTVSLDIQSPLVIAPKNGTVFYMDDSDDEDVDLIPEEVSHLVQVLQLLAAEYRFDADAVVGRIYDKLFSWHEISFWEIFRILKDSGELYDVINDKGFICYEDVLFGSLFERFGYDAIIDESVGSELNMGGVYSDTIHYTVRDTSKIIVREIEYL